MGFLETAKACYSVRSYKSQKVESEKLEKILEAAHVAPTAADLGLGSVWICYFKPDVIREEFRWRSWRTMKRCS